MYYALFPNNTNCRDLRAFSEIFWARNNAARKSIDFWTPGEEYGKVDKVFCNIWALFESFMAFLDTY